MLHNATLRMRVYRPELDGFVVVREFLFNDMDYKVGDTFWRAEAKGEEHQVERLFRLGWIDLPVEKPVLPPKPAPTRPEPALLSKPPSRPAARGR